MMEYFEWHSVTTDAIRPQGTPPNEERILDFILQSVWGAPETRMRVIGLIRELLAGNEIAVGVSKDISREPEALAALRILLDSPPAERPTLFGRLRDAFGTRFGLRLVGREMRQVEELSPAVSDLLGRVNARVSEVLAEFLFEQYVNYRESINRASAGEKLDPNLPSYPFAMLPAVVRELVSHRRPDLLPKELGGKTLREAYSSTKAPTPSAVARISLDEEVARLRDHSVSYRDRHVLPILPKDADTIAWFASFFVSHGTWKRRVERDSVDRIARTVMGFGPDSGCDADAFSPEDASVLADLLERTDIRHPLCLEALDHYLVSLPEELRSDAVEHGRIAACLRAFSHRGTAAFLAAFLRSRFPHAASGSASREFLLSHLPKRAKAAILRHVPSLVTRDRNTEAEELAKSYPNDLSGTVSVNHVSNLAAALFQDIGADLRERVGAVADSLRPNQLRTLPKVADFFSDPHGWRQGLVVKTTGLGKTIEFWHLCDTLKSPVVIRVSRTLLKTQTPEKLSKIVGLDPKRIVVLDGTAEKNLRTLRRAHLMTAQGKPPVVVMSDQFFLSLYRRKRTELDAFMALVRVVIEDESHRALGKKMAEAAKRYAPTDAPTVTEAAGADTDARLPAEDDEENVDEEAGATDTAIASYPRTFTLHYTATPRIDGKSVQEIYGARIIDRANLEDALRERSVILPRIPIFSEAVLEADTSAQPIDLENYLGHLAESGLITLEGIPLDDFMIGNYLHLRERFGHLPFVFYASTIAHAEKLKNALVARWVRAVRCTSKNAKYDEGTTVEVLERSLEKKQIDVVVTVMKLGEAWDNPRLRGAAWCIPPTADWMHLQWNGRPGRVEPVPLADCDPKSRDNTFILQPSGFRIVGAPRLKRIQRSGSYLDTLLDAGEVTLPDLYSELLREGRETALWIRRGCQGDIPARARHPVFETTAESVRAATIPERGTDDPLAENAFGR